MIFLKLIMRLLNKNITAKTADNYMLSAINKEKIWKKKSKRKKPYRYLEKCL